LLCERSGAETWVKHENHTATGAFKLRGGLVYVDRLAKKAPEVSGVIAATRGNHGQSVAVAAAQSGLTATIVVPPGNSTEKNAAMRALGAELINTATISRLPWNMPMISPTNAGFTCCPPVMTT
jgi:threonine dehydratase